MAKLDPFLGADLFCGAGGTSTGLLHAAQDLGRPLDLLAINHWTKAVHSHRLNHPGVRHLCETLDNISPRRVVPGGRLDLLSASPECTHHSVAAGGRPKNDQSRATAWHVCRWCADLDVAAFQLENVKEFLDWGPLDRHGKPLKSRRGETFRAFIQALRSMGYTVEWRVQNAADFGDPTSRRRLIILGRKHGPLRWPDPTHGNHGTGRPPWRTARDIIDWDLKGTSIFHRKRPLSANTLRRIAVGLRKFGGAQAEPFLVMLRGTGTAAALDRPLRTIAAHGNHHGLVEPFLMHSTHHGADASRCHSVHDPTPTVTGAHRGEMALVEPFLVPQQRFENCSADSVDQPLRTITTTGGRLFNLIQPVAEPFLVGCTPTITTAQGGEVALAEPFLIKYYGTGTAVSVDTPLDTVTTKDRFVLVEPHTGREIAELDIRFRMLQPHELAAAMSFPAGYQFTGTKEDQVKQIGNAVPVQLARAHARALLQP